MSHLRDVEEHARSLGEIRDIMNSMKSLAYMESRRLERIVEAQRAVTRNILAAAADVLQFFPQSPPAHPPTRSVRIVFGTERGFCGNVNERLVATLLPRNDSAATARNDVLIAVGRKLHGVLEQHIPPSTDVRLVEGAGVADESTAALNRIVAELDELQRIHGAVNLSSLYFDSERQLRSLDLLPSFSGLDEALPAHTHPPDLNLDPDALLEALTDQYVFSALYEAIHDSLRSENLLRVSHLTEAVRHLDDRTADLARSANSLRQEQITEEIEVILLSASSIEQSHGNRSS